MSPSNNLAIPARIRERRRMIQLSSDRRTGAHSRRLLRARQLRWIRIHWQLCVLTVPSCVALSALVVLVVPQPFTPYVVGALVASIAWLIYVLMLETGGLAPLRSGLLAEEWTASELRMFQAHGWNTVNHVMLEYGDTDHALVGPGGFFAVETKFRSDWADAKPFLDDIAWAASETARLLRLRIDPKGRPVRALVVLWGPDVRESFDACREVNGVMFCPGELLSDYLSKLPQEVEPAEIREAWFSLSEYVRNRDIGEVAESGELPRTVSDVVNDLLAVCGTVLVVALAILAQFDRRPVGLWSAAMASTAIGLSVVVRRWRPANVRLRLATTAAAATAAGLGLLMIIATAVVAFR